MAAEKEERVCSYFTTVSALRSHWESRISLSTHSRFYLTDNPTARAVPSLSTGRGFVFTMKSGNVVRLVIIDNLAAKLELIQKQNGHEVKDFVDQIENEYQKLNGLS
jgi:hypothetical protein